MLNEPTLEKLIALRLNALATVWSEQQRSSESSSLCFDERLALLIDAEWLDGGIAEVVVPFGDGDLAVASPSARIEGRSRASPRRFTKPPGSASSAAGPETGSNQSLELPDLRGS